VGEGVTEGGGLNFGPGQPANRRQVRSARTRSELSLRGREQVRVRVTNSNGVIFPGVRGNADVAGVL
jgi:hypothetical protein